MTKQTREQARKAYDEAVELARKAYEEAVVWY